MKYPSKYQSKSGIVQQVPAKYLSKCLFKIVVKTRSTSKYLSQHLSKLVSGKKNLRRIPVKVGIVSKVHTREVPVKALCARLSKIKVTVGLTHRREEEGRVLPHRTRHYKYNV